MRVRVVSEESSPWRVAYVQGIFYTVNGGNMSVVHTNTCEHTLVNCKPTTRVQKCTDDSKLATRIHRADTRSFHDEEGFEITLLAVVVVPAKSTVSPLGLE